MIEVPLKRATERQRAGLALLIQRLTLPPDAVMVEVGSYAGESAVIFAESGRFASITCVDPWDDRQYAPAPATPFAAVEAAFDERTRAFPIITKVRACSVDAAERFEDASLDLVYIDAQHDYANVLADIHAWRPKVRPGGYVTGHDFGPPCSCRGVRNAVRRVFRRPDAVFEDSSWVKRV